MNLPPPKVCLRIRKLHAMLGSSNAKEAENARAKLNRLLAEHGLTWNDLPAIFAAINGNDSRTSHAAPNPATSGVADAPSVNVLDLVLALIEEHVAITADERMAVALWLLHCWVFERYPITPRLALLSPVRGCGKTTLILLLELLLAQAYRTDNISAAAIYHRLDRTPGTTLLVDEGARAAAVALCADRTDEDPGVVLLADIWTVFQALGRDRIASALLVERLLGLDDNFWNEWRGPNDDRSPHKLTQGELSRLLRPFRIRPKTIWPIRRRTGDKSSRGYQRKQFEAAWTAYCASGDTPAQRSKIINLPNSRATPN
jgi:Protein of unknown function (DUF3631)